MTINRYHPPRRGLAMVLVMVGMTMATILALSYLASRRNSPAIGYNVQSSAAGRHAVHRGLDAATRILRSELDWRQKAATSGTLINEANLAGTLVGVTVLDVERNGDPMPPVPGRTRYVKLTSRTWSPGAVQYASATAYVPLWRPERAAAVDLSEFAAFGTEGIFLQNEATITRWPDAPLAELGRRVLIGTQSDSLEAIVLRNNSASIDTVAYLPSGSSVDGVHNEGPAPIDVAYVTPFVPMPGAPPAPAPETDGQTHAHLIVNGVRTISADARYRRVQLNPGAILTLSGDVELVAEEGLMMLNGSRLVIEGDADLVLYASGPNDASIELTSASIELVGATSRLRLYVENHLVSNDGFVGEYDGQVNNDGSADYFDPRRIHFTTIEGTGFSSPGARAWRLDGTSTIKGTIYAPLTSVELRDTATVYGRVAAHTLDMRNSSALFYDPTLDSRYGYSNMASALYDGGAVRSEVQSLPDLGPPSLASLAAQMGTYVLTEDRKYDPPAGFPPSDEPFEPVIPIEVSYDSIGPATDDWESNYAVPAGSAF